jgi:2-amino-4-hydroxy-6-hydroxymethyldihydropteridine diphosphokinase
MGRVRRERWGPRQIDLDVVLYGDLVVDEDGLKVPHPEMRRRPFVLVPLLDVASADMLLPPDGKRLGDVADDAVTGFGTTLEGFRRRRMSPGIISGILGT